MLTIHINRLVTILNLSAKFTKKKKFKPNTNVNKIKK